MKKLLPKTANSPQGFTLIELLVVISIIAILSVIGLAVYSSVQKNSRDARRKADIDAVSRALESDYATRNLSTYQATSSIFAGGELPQDPQNSGGYVYTITPDTLKTVASATYTICAKLEANSGGNSSSNTGAAAVNGGYFCRKNQQ